METPANRVQLIRSTSRQFGQYLHALPAASWNQPSACDRWEVRDVVGHLILGAELYFGIVSRGLHGDTSPPEGFPQAGTVNATSVAAFVDQMSVTRRATLGDQLLATFATTSDRLHQVFAQCRSHDWERLCYHPAGLVPVRTIVDMRLTELVMHGWDIRSKLELEAHLEPESFSTFVEMFTGPFGWFRWTLVPGMERSTPVRYRFEVTGPVSLRRDLVVEGHEARLEPVTAAPAHVTFCCAMEPFVLLLYGRLPLPDAIAAGHMTAEGATELIPTFAQWFRGM
jgi:uncharacterized protein (TIGR03083 family)